MKVNIDLRLLIDNSVEERIDINNRRIFNDTYIKHFTRNLAYQITEPIYKSFYRSIINPSCYHVPNYHETYLKKLLK